MNKLLKPQLSLPDDLRTKLPPQHLSHVFTVRTHGKGLSHLNMQSQRIGLNLHANVRFINHPTRISRIRAKFLALYHRLYHDRCVEMDLASSALASNRGISRLVQWEMVIRAADVSMSVEQAVRYEQSLTSLLQEHSDFNFGYCKHSTPSIVMISNKGGRKVKLGNRGVTMSHPSSVWSSITPQSRVVVSSASRGYRTEHPCRSRSFGPNPFHSFPLQPILYPYFSPRFSPIQVVGT